MVFHTGSDFKMQMHASPDILGMLRSRRMMSGNLWAGVFSMDLSASGPPSASATAKSLSPPVSRILPSVTRTVRESSTIRARVIDMLDRRSATRHAEADDTDG